jgi:ATP-dependent Lhr-like helicase
LAQQVVAMVALEPMSVDDVFATLRSAAPFHDLPRASFEGVLDLLSGRYPADEFAELRPRITWDRLRNEISPRRSSQRMAVLNAGTIPDRGLYGVFLADDHGARSRVGELDEEMVFETRPGDIFLLGASSWRVLDITQDRVLVAPAPGEPGRMPFWRGEGPGRPLEFGRMIGRFVRQLLEQPRAVALKTLATEHGLTQQAAQNLLQYLQDQVAATGEPPHDQSIVVECFLDEVGDWRIAILSPFGARVHAPWAMAVARRLRETTPGEVDMMWSDDGIVFRLPESDEPPGIEALVPESDEIEDLVVREIGSTALFAAHFRENAARALLLPKRQPGRRTPLWLQRRRSADLLAVAARYPSFPILLETYRECLRDVFDVAGLKGLLRDIAGRKIRVQQVKTTTASPFAASLLFNYTANFLYEGDAPLAERRAQTLALDHTQLRELLGDAEWRELLDAATIDEVQLELQRLGERYQLKDADAVHETLIYLGDLTRDELAARCSADTLQAGQLESWICQLEDQRRVISIRLQEEMRYIAAEDAARFRDALGVVLPTGLPGALLEPIDQPLEDLLSRYARTHGPFQIEQVARRFGMGAAVIRQTLNRLVARDRVLEGEFLPGGFGREWCDAEVLRTLKRRCLARLRKQVEPVAPVALARFLPRWQSIVPPRRGLDGLLDVIEQLQGQPLPASDLEHAILPRRVSGYRTAQLDELCAAGEVIWRGLEGLSSGDGRVALYLTDQYPALAPAASVAEGEVAAEIRELLTQRGASFFDDLVSAIGGFRNDLLAVLWQMVWAGEVTNDTLAPMRAQYLESRPRASRRKSQHRFRSRRQRKLPGSEGRWSMLRVDSQSAPSDTARRIALAEQLLRRYGILTRELVAAENIAGGFAGLYPVLKALEDAGKIRRGYFVAGLGAAQFASPGAEQLLRDTMVAADEAETETLVLAATDPANAYGAALRWPDTQPESPSGQRAAGARVILADGQLLGFLSRSGQQLTTYVPDQADQQKPARQALAHTLARLATVNEPVFLTQIDGGFAGDSTLADELREAGFVATSRGFLHRRKSLEDA